MGSSPQSKTSLWARLLRKRLWLSLGIGLLALSAGYASLESVETDGGSEQQAVSDAVAVVQGRARYGLVSYTHYPNGPSYLLLPALWMGVDGNDTRALRMIPLVTGVAAFTGLVYVLLGVASTPGLAALALLGMIAFFTQRGILPWLGALHQHSYVTSVIFLTMIAGLVARDCRWIYGALGFALGWLGYDPAPLFGGVAFTMRWLYHSRQEPWDFRRALRLTLVESLSAAGGVILAIGTHLMQNTLYFGSLNTAVRDLVGSAAARMDLDSASALNPEYARSLKEVAPSEPVTRLNAARLLIKALWTHGYWGRIFWRWLLWLSVPAIGWAAWKARRTSLGRALVRSREAWTGGLAAFGIFMAAFGWILVMPRHAIHHPHFLPRKFLITLALLMASAVAWSARAGLRDRSGAR